MEIRSAVPTASDSATDEAPPQNRDKGRQARQALIVWIVFFVLLVLFNGTIPFALGADLRAWTSSPAKLIPFGFVFYGVLFLAVPLTLIKGWNTVRRPAFLVPLAIGILGMTFWHYFSPGVTVTVAVLAYLHWRFDLSGYGIRSNGWKGDLAAILVMGLLGAVPVLMRGSFSAIFPGSAVVAALTRLFANPASSAENLFYFGFLAERLSYKTGKWLTPPLIALMYTAHEMSNPEYWYGGMAFGVVFVGIALWTAIYLWRRSAAVIWIGDGLYRFVLALF